MLCVLTLSQSQFLFRLLLIPTFKVVGSNNFAFSTLKWLICLRKTLVKLLQKLFYLCSETRAQYVTCGSDNFYTYPRVIYKFPDMGTSFFYQKILNKMGGYFLSGGYFEQFAGTHQYLHIFFKLKNMYVIFILLNTL